MLTQFLDPGERSQGRAGRTESNVIEQKNKKMSTLMQESARGAQRGLLLILGSALVWVLAIWVGFQFL